MGALEPSPMRVGVANGEVLVAVTDVIAYVDRVRASYDQPGDLRVDACLGELSSRLRVLVAEAEAWTRRN